MARALRAWAINPSGKNSVRNLQYGPRTRLVRAMSAFASLVSPVLEDQMKIVLYKSDPNQLKTGSRHLLVSQLTNNCFCFL